VHLEFRTKAHPLLLYMPAGQKVQFVHTLKTQDCDKLRVLCVLCVVVLFSVVEGPCKRYAMTQHVYQVMTASLGRRLSVSPEGD